MESLRRFKYMDGTEDVPIAVETSMDLSEADREILRRGVTHMLERNGKTLSEYSGQLARAVASMEKASASK